MRNEQKLQDARKAALLREDYEYIGGMRFDRNLMRVVPTVKDGTAYPKNFIDWYKDLLNRFKINTNGH